MVRSLFRTISVIRYIAAASWGFMSLRASPLITQVSTSTAGGWAVELAVTRPAKFVCGLTAAQKLRSAAHESKR
jgi:hypothetical protein